MIEVVTIKFKNRGKGYYFAPNGKTVQTGDQVIVETSKGLEIADCVHGNHSVEDTEVVQPLRPVVRLATYDDMRTANVNSQREKEAFAICRQKIAEHGLEMKLVAAECSFEGNKITFFFTSDGRVDFRELVKDLAGVFHNRIELRQIGVRDEAKMLGGVGICGRPYCCSRFLDDFQPVSTKMAKMQSLSLNPTKISGSCGRLMCCLRYEQEAYEDLLKNVPKQGAFVQTKDGYGIAEQINLLRQTVKVRLDGEGDGELKSFRACELATVPGGRPPEGVQPPSVLNYVPQEEEEEIPGLWTPPEGYSPEAESAPQEPAAAEVKVQPRRANNNRRRNDAPKGEKQKKPAEKQTVKAHVKAEPAPEKAEAPAPEQPKRPGKPFRKPQHKNVPKEGKPEQPKPAAEKKPQPKPAEEKKPQPKKTAEENKPAGTEQAAKPHNRRRGYYYRSKAK